MENRRYRSGNGEDGIDEFQLVKMEMEQTAHSQCRTEDCNALNGQDNPSVKLRISAAKVQITLIDSWMYLAAAAAKASATTVSRQSGVPRTGHHRAFSILLTGVLNIVGAGLGLSPRYEPSPELWCSCGCVGEAVAVGYRPGKPSAAGWQPRRHLTGGFRRCVITSAASGAGDRRSCHDGSASDLMTPQCARQRS